MSLQDEIKTQSSQIFKESYQMSIGELINLYKEGEMNIHPEFQRLFRWNEIQKTRLIESIMLNIPIPPIFVSQDDDGIWDIIDGVQRLSTIFQFVGVLKDEMGKVKEPLVLKGTEFLPSFAGVKWEDKNKKNPIFTKEQQLIFKRSRVDVNIVKKESDANAKYELFQRLNTGGSLLSDQEVRNCLMIMTNKEFYEAIHKLANSNEFIALTPISGSRADEQYRMELITRLIVSFYIDFSKIKSNDDFGNLLDKQIVELCKRKDIDLLELSNKISRVLKLIKKVKGENAYKRFEGGKHTGPVLVSAFQCITVGIYVNLENIESFNNKKWLKDKIEKLYEEEEFRKNTSKGTRSPLMYKELTKFGKEYFNSEYKIGE